MTAQLALDGLGARHSSETAEHYTPTEIVEPSRVTLGGIDLDPFSCALAQRVVRATRFYTAHDNGFAQRWSGLVFCNPPSGRTQGSSDPKAAWFKLVRAWLAGDVLAGAFLCFSVEQLQTTQVDPPPGLPIPLDFPICFPRRRVAYLCDRLPGPTKKRPDRRPTAKQLADFEATGLCTGESPPHASCLVLVPPRDAIARAAMLARFRTAFKPIGRVVVPEES